MFCSSSYIERVKLALRENKKKKEGKREFLVFYAVDEAAQH